MIRENTNIWEPEDPADRLYFVEKGQVRIVELKADGNEILLENINENDFFGESCFLKKLGEPRKTLARTLSDCTFVEFAVEDFRLLILENTDWLNKFINSVSHRLKNIERRVSILSSRGVEKRLGAILLYLANNQGIKINPPHSDKRKIFVTHEELAGLAAVSRQRITTTMNYFRQAGLIEYERTKPLVINIPALGKYLEFQDKIRSSV